MDKINKVLDRKEFIEISILGDGNCFYRCLSIHIEHTQEKHIYYRNLIFNFINENKKILQ